MWFLLRYLIVLLDRIVDGDEFGTIGEGCLYLYLVDHCGNAFHDIFALENGGAKGHDLGYAFAVAGRFHDLSGQDSKGFRVIEFEPARLSLTRQFGGYKNEEFFLFSRG